MVNDDAWSQRIMTTNSPDRLDRIEAMLERLVNIQDNQQRTIEQLVEGQLALQAQMGLVSEQTLQLKRAMDYLLSRDGEKGSSVS